MSTAADVATEVSTVVAVGAVLGTAARYWIRNTIRDQIAPVRKNTAQLEHNGGSHVADYAKDARDSSLRQEAALNEHLVQSAATHARHDTLIQMLLDRQK